MDLPTLLQKYNVSTSEPGHHHNTTGWIQVDCPFCSKDSRRYRLGLNEEGKAASCWSCGSHSVAETLVELTGAKWNEIKDLLTEIRKFLPKQDTEKKTGRLLIPNGVKPLLSFHKDYLRSRNLDPDILEKLWQVQGIGLAAKYAWRLFIPVIHENKIVSWTTRAISDEVTKRYINAPKEQEDISPKRLLFGSHLARNAIIICEGPLDAMRIGPGAVATMGLGYSKAQVNRILKYPVRAIVFDSEPVAQKRAQKLYDALLPYDGYTVKVELDAKDPGSASNREITILRDKFLE